MKIRLSKQRQLPPLKNRNALLRTLRAAARESGLSRRMQLHEELSITIMKAEDITAINRDFLKHNGPTDVITFDYGREAGLPESGGADILVCFDIAVREARSRKTAMEEELLLYCVHGMLHLCGLNDYLPMERRQMRREERRVMQALKKEFVLANFF